MDWCTRRRLPTVTSSRTRLMPTRLRTTPTLRRPSTGTNSHTPGSALKIAGPTGAHSAPRPPLSATRHRDGTIAARAADTGTSNRHRTIGNTESTAAAGGRTRTRLFRPCTRRGKRPMKQSGPITTRTTTISATSSSPSSHLRHALRHGTLIGDRRRIPRSRRAKPHNGTPGSSTQTRRRRGITPPRSAAHVRDQLEPMVHHSPQ